MSTDPWEKAPFEGKGGLTATDEAFVELRKDVRICREFSRTLVRNFERWHPYNGRHVRSCTLHAVFRSKVPP